jgi:hypothetical protein
MMQDVATALDSELINAEARPVTTNSGAMSAFPCARFESFKSEMDLI